VPDIRTVKKIFNWKPLTKRSQGRPKYRWEDNIKQDICQLKIKNWIACIQDQGKWKKFVEKPKLSTKGSSAPGRRSSRWPLEPTHPPVQWLPSFFPRVKQMGCDVCSHPFRAKVKNEWSDTSLSPICLLGMERANFTCLHLPCR
jgi:hypothetical protein